jgi:hypothetical protein
MKNAVVAFLLAYPSKAMFRRGAERAVFPDTILGY